VEYTSGGASWREALRTAASGLFSRPTGRRRSPWSIGVPLIAVAAGLLFTTSATTANGTSLRDDRRPQLAQLIEDRRDRVEDSDQRRAALLTEVEAETEALAGSDAPIAEQRRRTDASRQGAGFTALRGPGLTVELDDAPRLGETRPGNPSNDDLVVHQSDVQAVVNALWAGGGEAMSIMGVRVISTSAVRCVGNTLLLHGRVYSPPFKITAIGDPAELRRALDASDGVRLFRDAVDHFGLGYRETVEGNVTVPAYDGSSALSEVEVPK
jgi:uncharacterized protein YlxW (UPF0749 family)